METTNHLFQDRHEAGRKLAAKLTTYAGNPNLIVLALSGGGLAVAYEVAKALRAPLDFFVVRTMPVPEHGDLSMGVVVSGGGTVFNQNVIRPLDIPNHVIDEAVARERKEVERIEQSYHPGRPSSDLENKSVIFVDDGLCTGAMMADAVTGMRDMGAIRVVIAIPTALPETYAAYDNVDTDDMIVCAETPNAYRGVDSWYADNAQVGDDEIRRLLSSS